MQYCIQCLCNCDGGHISPQIAWPADTRNNAAETAASGNAPGCPPTSQDRRGRPPIPKTSHRRPTRDHSVPVGYCLSPIPSRYLLLSHLARLPSVLLPAAGNASGCLQRRRPDVARHLHQTAAAVPVST